MSELKHMHAKTECLPFNTEDVRLIITERYGKQEIRMHGEDARFIVEAIAAAKRRTQPEATKPAQDLGAAIMNICCEMPPALSKGEAYQYKLGHRDARHAAAELANEAALASPADALVAGDRVDAELLRKLRDYIDQKSKEYGYGFYRPANPHDFTPDADQCSEDEIAAHKAACEAFDKGEYTHDYSGCLREGGMHILHAPWGVGSYVIRDPEVQELLDAINAAIQAQKDGHAE